MTRKTAFALVLLVAAGLAWAGATKTWVESEIVRAELIYLGTGFIDDEGILHVKGQRLQEYLANEIETIEELELAVAPLPERFGRYRSVATTSSIL